MRNQFYKTYIESLAWERKRRQYWAVYGKRCQVCGSHQNLKVHHMTYERFGREALADLLGVCNTCHVEIHKFHRKTGGDLKMATIRYIHIYRQSQKP